MQPPAAEAAPAPKEVERKRPAARPKSAPHPPLAPLERRLRKQLAQGRSAIGQSIDLHGMTQAQAHQALRGLLHYAHGRRDRPPPVVTRTGAPTGRAVGPDTIEPPTLR